MSEITGEYARVREALAKPTIGLLGGKWSPIALAVFRVSFSRDAQFVPVDRLHTQVEEYLAELRRADIPTPDAIDGRALCRQWLNSQWLLRTTGEEGSDDAEQYSLTSHALEALATIDALATDRALISESRLTTILESVRRWALKASPDKDEQVRRLDAQIAELTVERDRLVNGGEVRSASAADMRDGYANLTDLLRQLPGDFKRVEESVLAMHRRIVQDFRDDERPIAAVLDEYLQRTDELMTATPEGRAFEGAFRLLLDEGLLQHLKTDLHTILEHPFSNALTAGERRDFRSAVAVIRKGVDDVLTQRSRLTSTLRDHIVNHDVIHDRELDATLRRITQLTATWMQDAGPRTVVELPLIPEAIDVEHLRERFYDPDVETPPPALVDEGDAHLTPLTIQQLRTQGGPLLTELRGAFAERIVEHGAATAGEAWAGLPEALRRPVELYGVLHILTQIGAGQRVQEHPPEQRPLVEAVRPNGELVRFRVPAVPLSADDASALLYSPVLFDDDDVEGSESETREA
ncbi:DUF3375 domain-containing protein [Microbacteriaceae bacterium VKM Ac-2855]|nr:DUF3375 domain-containing protein [Microbacteriaceae bacterium VKM Ac-2855]